MLAIIYLFSMLHFGLPSTPLDPSRDATFRGCRRGPQYAVTTLSPVNELLAQQYHPGGGEAGSQEQSGQLEGGQETGSQAHEKFYYFQGLYVPAIEPPEHRQAIGSVLHDWLLRYPSCPCSSY